MKTLIERIPNEDNEKKQTRLKAYLLLIRKLDELDKRLKELNGYI